MALKSLQISIQVYDLYFWLLSYWLVIGTAVGLLVSVWVLSFFFNTGVKLINKTVIVSDIDVSILPQTPFPSRLQHNIEQSSLRATLGRSSCFKTSQRYLTMSNAVIFDTHTFLPTLQFLSFLMIFFSLSHTCYSSEESIQIRSLLFSHFFLNETYSLFSLQRR